MTKTAHGRIDDIEALRAFAVLFTMLEHVRYVLFWGNDMVRRADLLFSFSAGVDLFFCISGFVIARSSLQAMLDAPAGEPFWRVVFAFWVRRVFRIWPSSLIWVLVVVLLGMALRNYGYFGSIRENIAGLAAVFTHTANFYLMSCLPANQCGGFNPWWSLSLEEQFYILLPFAALAFRQRIWMFLLAVVLVQVFVPRAPWSLAWVFRTDALALGVLIALFTQTQSYRMLNFDFMRKLWLGIPLVGMLLFALATLPEGGEKLTPVPFSTGLIALVSGALVLIASLNRNLIARSGPFATVMLWIGSRSYSLYLIHWVSIPLTKTLWAMAYPAGTQFNDGFVLQYLVVWLLFTGTLSELNYRLIETPLRKKGAVVASRLLAGGRTARDPAPPASSAQAAAPGGR